MDWRLLVSALVANAVGIIIFSIVYPTASTQSSVSAIAAAADDAIFLLALFAASGVALVLVGIVRRRPLSYGKLVILALGNFALGAFSLFQWFGNSLGYQDNQMACGGFPPGYWTTGNVTVNRCTIWVSVHQDWVSIIYGVILLVSVIGFWAVALPILRRATREAGAQQPDQGPVVALSSTSTILEDWSIFSSWNSPRLRSRVE